jgi:hypothetical protein
MRSVLMACVCVSMIGFQLLLPAVVKTGPQLSDEDAGEYLPIHAVLSVRGEAVLDAWCKPHGFLFVWEGDLEATDDDPDEIFPARYYEAVDEPFTTLKFDDWVCGDAEGRISYKHQYGSHPNAVVRLILAEEDAFGNFDRRQRVDFDGFDLGYIHISGDVTQPGAIIINGVMDSATVVPPLILTKEDFERGFDRTYHFKGNCDSPEPAPFACSHYDDHQVEGTLTLSYKQDTEQPKVEIAGCAHLLRGGSDQLTATGHPSGGHYKWSAEPSSVLDVSGSESSTSVKAGSPGRATVRVEYEAPNGKKAETTLPGSVVTLTSVNGGAAIPTLYLHDAYGNAKEPIEVPIAQNPPDGDLLKFEVADPSIATVMHMGSSLLIKGEHEGSTTAQAQTKCGEKTGPVITIQVAGCDPEEIAKLKENYKEVKKKLDESVSRVNKVITSKDFNESSDEIDDDVVDVAIETVDVVASGAAKLGSATKAVKTAEEVISLGSKGWNVYRDEARVTAIKAAVVVLVPGAGLAAVETYDKLNTLGKFLKHTSILLDADERIAREQPIQDGLSKELEQIDKLIEKCKQGSKGGEPEPKGPPPKPGPTPPKPKIEPPAGKPGGQEPPPGEPATPTQPEPGEPGGGETPPPQPPKEQPPPPPPEPPATPGGGPVGLPIDCGCPEMSTTSWHSQENGLAAIAQSLSLLQDCAEKYADELRSFQADSSTIAETVRSIEAALEIPGEEGFEQFRAALPGLKAAEKSWERLTNAAGEFSRTLEGCDKKVPEAAELIQKAGQLPETTTPGAKSK